jgi:hypothetical protein
MLLKQTNKELELERCRKDGKYFCRNYLWIMETRTGQEKKGWFKFQLWDAQERLWDRMEEAYTKGEWLVVEKCRGRGGSYVWTARALHHWLFDQDMYTALMGSRTQDEVDKANDPGTLFAKIDGYLSRLPDSLLPHGFNPSKHRTFLNLTNPANGNNIAGEAMTADFGSSNRATEILLDEAAKAQDVFDTCLEVTNTVIALSSAKGKNHFYRYRQRAVQLNRLFTLNWRANPACDEAWYADKKLSYTDPSKFAQEIDIDYTASVAGRIYPQIDICPIEVFEFNPDYPLYILWDWGVADDGVMLFVQRSPTSGELYIIDEVVKNNTGVEWFVPFVPNSYYPDNPNVYSAKEAEKIEAIEAWVCQAGVYHYGDPSGAARNANTGKSVFDMLREHGLPRPKCNQAYWRNMPYRQEKTRSLLRRLHIRATEVNGQLVPAVPYFMETMSQYAVPDRSSDSQATSPNNRAMHKFSHAASAIEAFAISEPPLANKPKELAAPTNPWRMSYE